MPRLKVKKSKHLHWTQTEKGKALLEQRRLAKLGAVVVDEIDKAQANPVPTTDDNPVIQPNFSPRQVMIDLAWDVVMDFIDCPSDQRQGFARGALKFLREVL